MKNDTELPSDLRPSPPKGSDILFLDLRAPGFFTAMPSFPGYFTSAWDYWTRLGDEGGGVPSKSDFDPMAVTDVLPHIILAELVQSPDRDYRLKVYGDSIDSRMRGPYSGKLLSELRPDKADSTIWAAYEEAVRAACPVLVGVPYVGAIPGIRYTRELYLPLASDGVPVSHVAVVVDFDKSEPLSTSQTRWSRQGSKTPSR